MKIPFWKYQGTGNDFIMIDQWSRRYLDPADQKTIERMCDRRFGIGGDGLILLEQHPDYDFKMVYFNSDGRQSSMCGNGGRCLVAFAHYLEIVKDYCRFLAIDGEHEAVIQKEGKWIELKMGDVPTVERGENFYFMDTGSPHYVTFVKDVSKIDVVDKGQEVRYSERFKKEGTNVNFVEPFTGGIAVATYERGVEDETLSCGTGVTAAAIAWYLQQSDQAKNNVNIQSKGGRLNVRFAKNGTGFKDVWLCGPAERVFRGVYHLDK